MRKHTVITGLTPEQENDGAIEEAVISRIIDADTVEVLFRGDTVDVRLLLIDAPETVHPELPVGKWGPEAAAFARAAVSGKWVLLEYDGPKWDAYGRLLAYLWVDGSMLNELLLQEGLAEVRYVYNPPYKYYDVFVEAQKRAMERRKGIWSEVDFRHGAGN